MKKALFAVLLLLTVFTMTGCKEPEPSLEDEILFDLILGEEIFIEVGETFYDPGLIVKHETKDISSYVVVTGNVDTETEGDYDITYTLMYEDITIVKTRTVTVGGFNFECDNVAELIVSNLNTVDTNMYCTDIDGTNLMSCQVIWSGTYLNTVVKVTLYVDKDTTLNTNEAFHHIEAILAKYTMISDKYKIYGDEDSVCSINQNGETVQVIDHDLYDLIDYTLDNQKDLEDFYDATMGTVLKVWHDYREDCIDYNVCKVPSSSILDTADKYTGSENVLLNDETTSITLVGDTTLDLGGMSKGYVSGLIRDYLDTLDIHGYLVNNGESNISAGGLHPTRENGKFIIAITDPTNPYGFFPDNIYATVYLGEGEQLVTSGDYQKYYTVDDTDYHHIISPESLMPLSNSHAVSIITSDPALADLYSTAIFNMTIEEGQTFVNNIDGLEAVWYGIDGTLYYSENFEANYLVDLYMD